MEANHMRKVVTRFASIFLVTLSLGVIACSNNKQATSEEEEVFQVNEAQFNTAISFKNVNYYKFHQDCSGVQMDNTVNNMNEVVYTEKSEYWNSFYVREKDGYVYLYDWQPSENIYYKYRDGEINDMDGFAINTIPFYTKSLKYSDFTYQANKKAYYQERSEEEGGLPGQYQTRRVYLYFKYQKLVKLEYFIYLDKTDGQDRIITVEYNDVWPAHLSYEHYIDKGDIGDNM